MQQCRREPQAVSGASYPGGYDNFVNGTPTANIMPSLDNSKTSFCPGNSGQYIYQQVIYAMQVLGTVWLPVENDLFGAAGCTRLGRSGSQE